MPPRSFAMLFGGLLGGLLLVGCDSGGTSVAGTGGKNAGGSAGTNAGGTVGSGGKTGSGGSNTGGTVSTSGAGGSAGGSGTTTAPIDAAAALDSASVPDAPPAAVDMGYSNGMIAFYEAEAVPPNRVFGNCLVKKCTPACPGTPADLVPEAECCSGGGQTNELIRGHSGLELNKVNVPADGTYDITWWYHCGENDNFGDGDCGGEPNHPASGCRPHVFTVNGTKLPKVYEFHCFPGAWIQIHAATTPIPLKAGDNTISVVATNGKDAADIDAISIFPEGKGLKPVAFTH